jgi:polyhydroxyalkanoate synthase
MLPFFNANILYNATSACQTYHYGLFKLINKLYSKSDFLYRINSLIQKDLLTELINNIQQVTYPSYALNNYFGDKNRFMLKEFSEAFSVENSIFNPEVVEVIRRTNGVNLKKGAENFLADVEKSPDGYFIINTKNDNFTYGVDIAATAGKVIFQNNFLQLIEYNAQSNSYTIPILIITALINKYYVLDLDPQFSFVKWLIDQKHRVLIISWNNPDQSFKDISMNDYINTIIEVIDFIQNIYAVPQIHCIGYCMGGTLAAIVTSYLYSIQKRNIASLTLLTTLTDFQYSGDIKILITDEIIHEIEQYMLQKGYLAKEDLFMTFSLLKSKDMIWYYFVNNYLMGKEPSKFSVLYWNSDGTKLPYKFHSQYLRDLYLDNKLVKNQFKVNNHTIKLSDITCPVYHFAAEEDHIAPWDGIKEGLKYFCNANNHVILSTSGHVAAVINHPNKHKYGYWYGFNGIKFNNYITGSWWDNLHQWLINIDSDISPTPQHNLSIEIAPGSYIKRT